MTSNLTWSKNDLCIFCRNCYGLSNAVYRLSLSFLVFESSGGGGRSSAPPPPPAVRRWLRPPAVRGLRSIFSQRTRKMTLTHFLKLQNRSKNKVRKITVNRARPGAVIRPLRFFADSEKTAAPSAAKFAIAIQSTIWHISKKRWPDDTKGHASWSH